MALDEYFCMKLTKSITPPSRVFKGNKYRISVLSDVLIRFEYSETGSFNDYPTIFALNRCFDIEPTIEVKEDKNYLTIKNNYFYLEYTKEKPFLGSKLTPDANLRVKLLNTDKIWYYKHPEVRNFLGSSFGVDGDKGTIRFKKGLYSTDGFASIDDTGSPVFITDGSVRKNPSNSIDVYLFIYRKDFGACLTSYFKLTGYPSMIPRFSLGVWWNKNENYNEKNIFDLVSNFKKNEIPFSVLMLGDKWHRKIDNNKKEVKSSYTFNKELFPEPTKLVNYLHNNNIFFGLKINADEGIRTDEESYPIIKQELGLTKDANIPFNVYDEKFVNSYFKNIVNPLNNIGVDLFWIDEINSKDKMMNFLFKHYSFKQNDRNTNRRGIILSKNTGISTHRYPVLYSGETTVGWKTLKMLPYINSSAANIGVSWWSHDIGGYHKGTEDSELYMRYVQFGTYSPIFRLASEEGRYYKREPWNWDVKTLNIVSEYLRQRHKLIPYLYTEAYKYTKTGSPLIQPLYYKYPETYDEPLYKNEYFFGTELFVCPITEPKDKVMNRVVQRLFIPDGMWYDFKTGKKFPGGKRYVTFYKDEDYPVFAKSGSIIPLAILDENNLNDTTSPKNMEIHVFPGRSNSYKLYEDDGISSLYKEGYYIITHIDYNYRENNYTLIIRPIEGKSGLIPEKRNYKIRFRNTRFAENVKTNIDANEVENNSYEDDLDFVIEVNDVPTTSQLTINCAGKAIEIDAVRIINEDIDSIISDLQIPTRLKEMIADIIFSDKSIRKKRIEIKKLRSRGLDTLFIKMFIKLLEYIAEI